MAQPLTVDAPIHTLHTLNPVKRVFWRPECDTELLVVPRPSGLSSSTVTRGGAASGVGENTTELDGLEVWDVRRGWIAKYVIEGGEGPISGPFLPFIPSSERVLRLRCVDATWGSPESIWAVYGNGSLIQHDIRESYRPLDNIPRGALSWEPTGGVVFAGNDEGYDPGQVPFDDPYGAH